MIFVSDHLVNNEEVDNADVDNEEVDNEEVDNADVDNEYTDNEDTVQTTLPVTIPTIHDPAHPGKSFFVYFLESSRTSSTYIGATMDVHHRLRQHNREIKGGAIITKKGVERGELWHINRYVSGFPTWKTALSFEWRWKQLSRKCKCKSPIDRRCVALINLLNLPQATVNAIPYSQWPAPPKVHIL